MAMLVTLASLSLAVRLAAQPVPDSSAATNMEDQRDEVVQVISPLSIFIYFFKNIKETNPQSKNTPNICFSLFFTFLLRQLINIYRKDFGSP